ncbi:MAG: site-2 protease family protein [Pirellulaceae bacterium]
MSSQSLVSSSSRPLRVRIRPDLAFVRQTYQGRDYWVVKDPLSLKFYRFEEEEFALLRMLDGSRSADDVRHEFTARFAPQKITNRELFQFIGSLYRSSLLISDATGQAVQLERRSTTTRRQEARAKATNILAIRFRGFDPDRILSLLNNWVGWVFSPTMVILCCLLLLSAIGLVVTHFEQFQTRLPAFQEFFAMQNWLWLGLVLAVTKVLHELGHGLACKRFGSHCHSMGVMFLVLMPCLYCDVSDSWTLASKWRRAAIAAAGMYVEFILASICAFIWWFSEPGWVNMLALNVVFVCSVSTLLFNANPLLRYDGYYILSDLIEVPNLRQKASSVLKRFCCSTMLGIEQQPDPFLPKRRQWLFATYSVLAVLYRWFITLSIFWFLYNLLEPYGLKLIGQAIAVMALYGLLGMPLIQLYRYFSTPGRLSTVNRHRFAISAGIIAVLLSCILLFPTPHYVRCSFIIQPRGAANVFVEVPGQIDGIHAVEGMQVDVGQVLISLRSHDLAENIIVLEGEERLARTRYHSNAKQANYDEEAAAEVESALASWESVTGQLQQRQQDVEQLAVRSPIAGQIVTAAWVPQQDTTDSGRLAAWHGHPLELRNHGAWVDQGTLVCQVTPDSEKLEAILAIDQSDVEFISAGNQVDLWLRQSPGQLVGSKIDIISPVEMKSVPKSLSSQYGGYLNTTRTADGVDEPLSTTYQVRVPLDQTDEMIVSGSTGLARIRTGNQTIGYRFWRFMCKTFRFDLWKYSVRKVADTLRVP